MRKKFLIPLVFLGILGSLFSCKKSSTTEPTSDKEAALQQAVTPYVQHTVVATYSAMADAGMTL